jgi:hypothetical protein
MTYIISVETRTRHLTGDETMATATITRVSFDPEESLYLVFDRDNDVVDGYETREEAD